MTVGEREQTHVARIAHALGVTVDDLWQQGGDDRPTSGQGFAALPPSTMREIAYAASQIARTTGHPHRWTTDTARRAGRESGRVRSLMAAQRKDVDGRSGERYVSGAASAVA